MANIIPSGTGDATSAEFTLAAGDTATLFITSPTADDATPGVLAKVQIKAASGAFTTVGELKYGQLARVLSGAGTYRVWRPAQAAGMAFGVEKI
jgi:hypothetical protein